MKANRIALLIVASLVPCLRPLAASDPFAENVRPTNALPEAEEQAKFHLPPGFEIQLVAAEPAIGKPFNIAFDAKGRLWMTCSQTYPFPAKDGKSPMDRIMILEEFDDAGHARKITTFADNLNIPIGLYPYKDGCIAYTIPNITYFHVGADGQMIKEPLVGPFSFDRDTHGMASNFRRGLDGWLYGCHGFNNITHAKAKDGSELNLNSGNVYRFKVDGSHAEQFTWGQTNPFGLAFDDLGNLYSSDSHSKPFYQLIRGGYYEGIGKKDDGLGFAPMMMHHFHNSTAIASTFLYTADAWPVEYRNNCFCGNVVTSRINRDSVTYKGTTPVAKEEPDFLTTEDPWFRPVQLQMGPDGQMWVADFYNKIIGHYEVPLTHPARDHTHGRIWRIVYKGDKEKAPAPWRGDLTKASTGELTDTLRSPNLMLRMLATDQLSDRIGANAIASYGSSSYAWNTNIRVHQMWMMYRLGAIDAAKLAEQLRTNKSDRDEAVAVHSMHILSEITPWDESHESIALGGLLDNLPNVARAATEALGRHPKAKFLKPLLDVLHRVPADDTHFQYTIKVALRETLKSPGAFAKLADLAPADTKLIAEIATAVPTEESGKFVAAYLTDPKNNAAGSGSLIKHAFRYAPPPDTAGLIGAVQKAFANDLDTQTAVLKGITDAAQQRGSKLDAATLAWSADLTEKLLTVPAANPKQTTARQQAGAELAKSLRDPKFAEALEKLARDAKADPAARTSAAQAMAACDANRVPALVTTVADANTPISFRETCVQLTAAHPALREQLIPLLRSAPIRLQLQLAIAMAGDRDGAEQLFAAVQSGAISPRVLQVPFVTVRLQSSKVPDLDARIAAFTKGLGSPDAQLQGLIDARRGAFPKAKPDVAAGFQVFTKNCVVCHSIDGKGAVVGPQLDGIGNRGIDRLLEDVLDPNRSVDPAFHPWLVKLKDGSEISGLQRREEGETIVYVDGTGKEIAVAKSQIAERKESNLSLMPSNFGEVIPEKDFNDLMAFLLSKNAATKK